jgi:hypothetical protein
MSQLFQQHGGGQRQRQHFHPRGPKPQRKPMRIIKPELKVDFQSVVDWFGRLLCLGFWGGVVALLVWCVLTQHG